MPFRFIRNRWRPTLALLTALVIWLSVPGSAHEIPNDVTIQVFVKPEAQKLRLLIRAPLEAMTDIDWPMTGSAGILDIARADPFLHDAATLWLGDNLQISEDGTRLPYPTVVGGPRLAAGGRRLSDLRAGARTDPRAQTAVRHRAHQEPGDARRPLRISNRVRPVEVLGLPAVRASRHSDADDRAVPAPRRRRSRLRAAR